jgi:hypothetical protein
MNAKFAFGTFGLLFPPLITKTWTILDDTFRDITYCRGSERICIIIAPFTKPNKRHIFMHEYLFPPWLVVASSSPGPSSGGPHSGPGSGCWAVDCDWLFCSEGMLRVGRKCGLTINNGQDYWKPTTWILLWMIKFKTRILVTFTTMEIIYCVRNIYKIV